MENDTVKKESEENIRVKASLSIVFEEKLELNRKQDAEKAER